MNFFALLVCALMVGGVFNAPDSSLAAPQKRSLGQQIKGSWIAHQRRQAAATTATGLNALIGGTITRTDLTNLAKEFLGSQISGGPVPKSSQVGKTKGQQIYAKILSLEKAGSPPALTPKSAQTYLRILRRMEGTLGGGKSSQPTRRQATRPPTTLTPSPSVGKTALPLTSVGKTATTPPVSASKTVKELLKTFIESLPELTAATGSSTAKVPKLATGKPPK